MDDVEGLPGELADRLIKRGPLRRVGKCQPRRGRQPGACGIGPAVAVGLRPGKAPCIIVVSQQHDQGSRLVLA